MISNATTDIVAGITEPTEFVFEFVSLSYIYYTAYTVDWVELSSII